MIPAYTGPLSGAVETKFCGLLESVAISVVVVVVCEVNKLVTVSVEVTVCELVEVTSAGLADNVLVMVVCTPIN